MKVLTTIFSLLLSYIICVAGDSEFRRLEVLQDSGNFKTLVTESLLLEKQYADSSLDKQLTIKNYLVSGYIGTHDYENALRLLNKTIEIRKPDSLRYYDLLAYIAMNDVFSSLQLLTLSNKAIEKGEEVLKLIGSINEEEASKYKSHLSLAKAVKAHSEGNLTRALQEWKAVEFNSQSDSNHRLTWLGMGGTIYEDMGEYEKSSQYYSQALEDSSMNPNKARIFLRYVSQEINRKRYEEATELIEKYGDKFNVMGDPKMEAFYLYALGYINYKTGQYQDASRLFAISHFLSDSISKAEDRLKNELIAQRIDPSDYSALEKRIENDRETHQRMLIFFLIIFILLCLVISITLVLKGRAQRSALKSEQLRLQAELDHSSRNNELKEQLINRQSELEKQTSQLEAKDQELAATKNALLEKDKEMKGMTLEISKSTSAIDTIQSEVRKKEIPLNEKLRNIESALREANIDLRLRDSFQMNFDRTNQRLYQVLNIKHPDLSKSELSMCAYILLNLNSKEIAELTHRSVRTVDNIKYTLRKKLGIEGSTLTYLQTLLTSSRDNKDH